MTQPQPPDEQTNNDAQEILLSVWFDAAGKPVGISSPVIDDLAGRDGETPNGDGHVEIAVRLPTKEADRLEIEKYLEEAFKPQVDAVGPQAPAGKVGTATTVVVGGVNQ